MISTMHLHLLDWNCLQATHKRTKQNEKIYRVKRSALLCDQLYIGPNFRNFGIFWCFCRHGNISHIKIQCYSLHKTLEHLIRIKKKWKKKLVQHLHSATVREKEGQRQTQHKSDHPAHPARIWHTVLENDIMVQPIYPVNTKFHNYQINQNHSKVDITK